MLHGNVWPAILICCNDQNLFRILRVSGSIRIKIVNRITFFQISAEQIPESFVITTQQTQPAGIQGDQTRTEPQDAGITTVRINGTVISISGRK